MSGRRLTKLTSRDRVGRRARRLRRQLHVLERRLQRELGLYAIKKDIARGALSLRDSIRVARIKRLIAELQLDIQTSKRAY